MIANLYETGYAIQPPITIPGNPITTATKSSDIAVVSLKGATTVTKPDPDADISPTNIATITGIANPTITASSGAASNSQTISGELYSLPNGTADEYDGQAARLTKRIGKIVLDGTEEWGVFPSAGSPYLYTYDFSDLIDPSRAVSSLCTHYVYALGNEMEGYQVTGEYPSHLIFRPNNVDRTVEAWKAYLAAQAEANTPVTIYYELAAPEITEAAYDLTCYDGDTTFSAPGVPAENLSVTLLDGRTVGNAARLGGQPPYVYQQSNPNLLINGGFQVWQRGTEFTNPRNQYVLDMFRDVSGSGEAEMVYQKVEGGLFVSYYAPVSGTYLNIVTFLDLEEQPYLRGKTLTLSTFISQLNGAHFWIRATESPGFLVQPYNQNIQRTLALGLNTITFTITEDPAIKYLCLGFTRPAGATSTAQESFTANYLKLELGPVATPYVPTDYGTELAKCQRYLLPISIITCFPGLINHEKKAYCSIPTPVTMQSLPTLTNTSLSDYQIGVNGTYYNPATITIFNMSASTVNVCFTFSDNALDEIPILTPIIAAYTNPNEPCYLSAEL